MMSTYRRSTNSLPHAQSRSTMGTANKRFVTSRGISPTPLSLTNVEPELKDAHKTGTDYHISMNLNALLAGGAQTNMTSKTDIRKTTNINRNDISSRPQRSNVETSRAVNVQNLLMNGDAVQMPKSSLIEVKTDDDVLYIQAQQMHQKQQLQQQVQQQQYQSMHLSPLRISSGSSPQQTYQRSPQMRISSTLPSPQLESNSYRVTSVSSSPFLRSDGLQRNTVSSNNQEVVCFLDLSEEERRKEKIITRTDHREIIDNTLNDYIDGYQSTKKTTTSYNRHRDPIISSRLGPRELPEEEAPKVKTKKENMKELVSAVTSHNFIRVPEGSGLQQRVEIEEDNERTIGPLSAQQSEGLINVDIVTEKVDVELKNDLAKVNIEVRCERVVPIPELNDMFKQYAVVATKMVDIDLSLTETRQELYDRYVDLQNVSAQGHLSQQDTYELYNSLMQMTIEDQAEIKGKSKSGRSKNRSGGAYANTYTNGTNGGGEYYSSGARRYNGEQRQMSSRGRVYDMSNGSDYYGEEAWSGGDFRDYGDRGYSKEVTVSSKSRRR